LKEFDAVEIATKQRHLHLLKRIKANKKLSAAELAELKEYEEMAKAKKGKKAQSGKGTKVSGDTFTSQKAAAAYAGVDVRTIQRWKARGMPVIDLGGKKVGYTKAMLTKFKKMAEGDALNAELKTEEIGLKSIRRQKEKMQLDALKRDLIPADEVRRRDIEKITAAKRVLLAMPRKLAPILKGQPTGRIQQIIKKEVYRCLDVLAGKKVKKPQRSQRK